MLLRSSGATVACFAAALTGVSVTEYVPVPTAEAALVVLTFSPTTVTYSAPAGYVSVSLGSFGEGALIFGQFNNSLGKGPAAFTGFGPGAPSYLLGGNMALAASGSVLSTATFSGISYPASSLPTGFLPPGGSGTYFWAFETPGGDIGWFSFSTTPSGDVIYLGGAIETTTGTITVGAVPEPSSIALSGLAMLALGATALRRIREEREELDAA